MSKVLPILLALGFTAMSASAPVFAQKKSCQEVCAHRCMNAVRNSCIPGCTAKCIRVRSDKSLRP